MGERFTYGWVEQFIEKNFPDPEPDLECVRAMRAVIGVLLSAVSLDTVFPTALAEFTGFDTGFIAAIAWNMQNNNLWLGDEYDHSRWLSETGAFNSPEFEEHVAIALGETWCDGAQSGYRIDVYQVFRRR